MVLHPNDWWEMRLTKDGFGRYILGDPQTNVRPSLFGLDVVYTTSIANGTFLVGSGNPIASEIRDRMEMQVEILDRASGFLHQEPRRGPGREARRAGCEKAEQLHHRLLHHQPRLS